MNVPLPQRISTRIAGEISAGTDHVAAAIDLLDSGATVPFIARYRKEATGGLDDGQLRTLAERLVYLRELEQRRAAIVKAIVEQGKMDGTLEARLAKAETKAELEDLYRPYKPRRRSRATIAREQGLAPLLETILNDRRADPATLAAGFLNEEVADAAAALAGARDILAEDLSQDADLTGRLRTHMRDNARIVSQLIDGKEAEGAKFSDYFDHSEAWARAAGHRILAMLRGRNAGILDLDIVVEPDAPRGQSHAETMVRARLGVAGAAAGDLWLAEACGWAWRVKLRLGLTLDLMAEMRERAEIEAIGIFARNLHDLLLAAPAGGKTTIGLDPGIRTGVKVAVVDPTGRCLDTATIYPFPPRRDRDGATATLRQLIRAHGVALIAIGNGTASRETEQLVAEVLADLSGPRPVKVVVSEAGASVYSASELAAREFPDLDVSLRGAVSIARRLQDPLAELVKIEPKAIGVGQYQHDVDQTRLGRALDAVVEDAVNAVGVDLNTASAPLLARVSGLGPALAEAIVAHRDAHGPFAGRTDLLSVPRLGPRAFEQAAGFLRIPAGAEPLDASAVHPEAYALARRILATCGCDAARLRADPAPLRGLDPARFTDDRFGLPTVRDIIAELEKPGRDPRPDFRTARFAEGIETITDLRPGMQLEGTVTNVAAFGAFVDIGVHQDGLVHVSQLADRFVKDPHAVVKAGDVVKVRVLEVDVARKRIGLSMRSADSGDREGTRASRPAKAPGRDGRAAAKPDRSNDALAAALGAALRKR